MPGNVFSHHPPWPAAVLIGSGLLWPTSVLAALVIEPLSLEGGYPPTMVTASPHPAPAAEPNPLSGERPPAGPRSSSPDATLPLPDVAMSPDARRRHSLFERIRTHGRLPVIVRLEIGAAPPGAAESDSETSQQAMIAATQQQVIERLFRATGTTRDRLAIKTFSLTPALGLQVDERELRELLTYPEVSDVVEDAATPPLDR